MRWNDNLSIRKPTEQELKDCEMIELTSQLSWNPHEMSEDKISRNDYEAMVVKEEQERESNFQRSKIEQPNSFKYRRNLLFLNEEALEKTFKNTTQLGKVNLRIPMRRHYKSRNPLLQRHRFNENMQQTLGFHL